MLNFHDLQRSFKWLEEPVLEGRGEICNIADSALNKSNGIWCIYAARQLLQCIFQQSPELNSPALPAYIGYDSVTLTGINSRK